MNCTFTGEVSVSGKFDENRMHFGIWWLLL